MRPDTIRYYERVGLLEPPPRTSGDHRRYDYSALDRLRFVRGAQRLGLRLAEIRELLELRDQGKCPCDEAAVLLRRRLVQIDNEIGRLQRLRSELAHMIDNIRAPNARIRLRAPGVHNRGDDHGLPVLRRNDLH